MGNESFRYLYPVIKAAAAEGTEAFVSAALSVMDVRSEKGFKEEAKKLIAIMDGYVEPDIPFWNIPREQIEKAFMEHERRYEFVIWSNRMAGTDEDCARIVKDSPGSYQGYSREHIRQVSYETCSENLDIMKTEMCTIDPGAILIYGAFARPEGEKPACIIRHSMLCLFNLFTGDDCTLYIKDGDLQVENIHYEEVDGHRRSLADHFKIFHIRDGVDVDGACWETKDDIFRDKESIVPLLDRHFGWNLSKKGGAKK